LLGLQLAALSSGVDEHPASNKVAAANDQAQTTDNLARSMRDNFLERFGIDYIDWVD
jgi:hypothetical protein